MTKKAIIYTRVSTGQQADKELPLESQEEQCRKKAESLGAEVIKVFSDKGVSGRTDARPEFQNSISYCEFFEVDYFITWSTSRFARNVLDARLHKERLGKCGVSIEYVSVSIEDSDGGFLQESILEIFDEYFSRQVSSDTRRSMAKNARDGFWNGGHVPFGFKLITAPSNDKKKILSPVESEARIVREIFDLRINGMGTKRIADKLNSTGISKRGRKWSKSNVADLLKSERMMGQSVFGKRKSNNRSKQPKENWIIIDSHEPIVSKEQWDQVCELMDGETFSQGSPKSNWLFTGILRCGCCDLAMRIESAKGRNQRYYYYNCASAQKGMGCKNRRISAPEFDEWMSNVVAGKIFNNENLRKLIIDMNSYYGTWAKDQAEKRSVLTGELSRWKRKLNRLYEILEDSDDFDLGDLAPRLKENKTEVRKLELEINTLDREEAPEVKISEEDISMLRSTLIAALAAGDAERTRNFFKGFIDKVLLKDDEVVIKYRADKILTGTTSKVVPSQGVWLPDHSLLGTTKSTTLHIKLPEKWARAA